MKETLNTSEIADRLFRDENAGFTYAGARALAEYLDTDENEDAEFDRVAIRCDYLEYESLQKWGEDYSGGWNKLCEKFGEDYFGPLDDETPEEYAERFDDAIREYINKRGILIEFEGGIIVSQF